MASLKHVRIVAHSYTAHSNPAQYALEQHRLKRKQARSRQGFLAKSGSPPPQSSRPPGEGPRASRITRRPPKGGCTPPRSVTACFPKKRRSGHAPGSKTVSASRRNNRSSLDHDQDEIRRDHHRRCSRGTGESESTRAREGSGKVCGRESVVQPVILRTSRDPAAHPEEEAADRNVVA